LTKVIIGLPSLIDGELRLAVSNETVFIALDLMMSEFADTESKVAVFVAGRDAPDA
jgi:hypothetical protein